MELADTGRLLHLRNHWLVLWSPFSPMLLGDLVLPGMWVRNHSHSTRDRAAEGWLLRKLCPSSQVPALLGSGMSVSTSGLELQTRSLCWRLGWSPGRWQCGACQVTPSKPACLPLNMNSGHVGTLPTLLLVQSSVLSWFSGLHTKNLKHVPYILALWFLEVLKPIFCPLSIGSVNIYLIWLG
jgi:hypothetical protein